MAERINSATATAKTVRIAPRKVRLVIDLIRGKKVGEAIAVLKYKQRSASPVIEKVLLSAIANAGASFRPSPIIAVGPSFLSSLIVVALPSGRSSA